MSDAEYHLQVDGHDATAWERFKAHAGLRKYSILNDFIWGLGNLACFFWLTGTGTLGYYGNIATTALLLMDVVVSGFAYYEEKKQHEEDLKRYERDILELNTKIGHTEGKEQQILRHQLKTLEKAKARCLFEWTHKTYRLIKDWTYATALILAFVTMCCFLLPPTAAIAPATAMLLSVGGTALCFTFTLINDATSGYLNVVKSEASAEEAKKEIENVETGLLKCFEKAELGSDLRKLLYLEMLQLRAEFDYQKETAHFQKMQLVHSMFLRLFVPPLVVASFIFFPLGIGLPILATGFALAHQSNKLYMGAEPEKRVLPEELDKNAFLTAFSEFEQKTARNIDDLQRFFPKKPKPAGQSPSPDELSFVSK